MPKDKISSRNREVYSSLYYNKYEKYAFEVLSKAKIFRKITHKVSFQGKSVLEIGFGTGSLIPYLLSKGAKYYGTEISKSAIIMAKKRYKDEVKLELIKKTEIPFNKIRFDIIILSHVLEHIKEEACLLKKCSNILNKEGLIILGVPCCETSENELHYRLYNESGIRTLLSQFHLSTKKIFTFKRILLFDQLRKTSKNSYNLNKNKFSSVPSILKWFYYFLISPLISIIYSTNMGLGKMGEIWVIAEK